MIGEQDRLLLLPATQEHREWYQRAWRWQLVGLLGLAACSSPDFEAGHRTPLYGPIPMGATGARGVDLPDTPKRMSVRECEASCGAEPRAATAEEIMRSAPEERAVMAWARCVDACVHRNGGY